MHPCHWLLDLVTAGGRLYSAHIVVTQDFSREPLWCASRQNGFFYQAFDGFGADTLGCFLLKKLHNFSDLSRMLFDILLCLILFFCCQLWRTSTPFFVLESSKMMRFPGIKPIVEGNTINRAYCHECSSRYALGAQYNTMSALSNTMMLTLLIQSMKHAASFWASIVNTSHL